MFADDVKIVSTLEDDNFLQTDLRLIQEWSLTWDLPRNNHKCTILPNSEIDRYQLQLNNEAVPYVDEIKDLRVRMHASFKPSAQCVVAANKARRALFVQQKAIASTNADVWIPLYKAYARPHLEYCVKAWSPYLNKDMAILEHIQRMATRWVTGLKGFPYFKRLKRLDLFGLERRRLRGDLIEVYKEVNHSSTGRLELRNNRPLRGHNLELKKKHCRLDVPKGFFTHRVVNPWNVLLQDVVKAPTLESFKYRLESCWLSYFPDII